MAGIDTLAMEESNTFMNVAKDKASVPNSSISPCRGSGRAGATGGALISVGRWFGCATQVGRDDAFDLLLSGGLLAVVNIGE